MHAGFPAGMPSERIRHPHDSGSPFPARPALKHALPWACLRQPGLDVSLVDAGRRTGGARQPCKKDKADPCCTRCRCHRRLPVSDPMKILAGIQRTLQAFFGRSVQSLPEDGYSPTVQVPAKDRSFRPLLSPERRPVPGKPGTGLPGIPAGQVPAFRRRTGWPSGRPGGQAFPYRSGSCLRSSSPAVWFVVRN
jgi:hypothetical protein